MLSLQSRKLSSSSRALWLLVLPLAFDFKGVEAGGQIEHWVILSLTLIGAIGAWVHSRGAPVNGFATRSIGLPTIAALVLGLIPIAAGFATMPNYFRTVLPYLLFAVGFVLGQRFTQNGGSKSILHVTAIGCGISLLFTFYYGLSNLGWDLSVVRYQIMSPAIFPFQALVMHQIVVERKRQKIFKVALIVCVMIELLSVTRSALLATGILFVFALWLSSKGIVALFASAVRGVFLIFLLAVPAGVGVQYLAPELSERWMDRVFGTYEAYGVDLTTLSRIAEIDGQLELWSESPFTMMFGRGIGSEYSWHPVYFSQLSPQFTSEILARSYFEAGHNFWVYSLFTGGVVSGFLLPGAIIWLVVTNTVILRKQVFFRNQAELWKFASRGNIVLVGFLVNTIGGNPFSYRFSALVYGLFAASAAVCLDSLRKHRSWVNKSRSELRDMETYSW